MELTNTPTSIFGVVEFVAAGTPAAVPAVTAGTSMSRMRSARGTVQGVFR